MGLGDQIIATGLARGAAESGRRIAFGDGRRILWDKHSEQIFKGNPNIALPGSEGSVKNKWVAFYKGHRGYNRDAGGRWEWNMAWRCQPGEIFLSPDEERYGERYGKGFVLIEPNVEPWKLSAQNKDWGFANYQKVATKLRVDGYRVGQFVYHKGDRYLDGAERFTSATFRDALAILKNAALYIGAEGGLHHGAAAVGVPGVVIFGGWIPPQVTGYDMHTNIANGDEFCGSLKPCAHCRVAMAGISVDQVYAAAKGRLRGLE